MTTTTMTTLPLLLMLLMLSTPASAAPMCRCTPFLAASVVSWLCDACTSTDARGTVVANFSPDARCGLGAQLVQLKASCKLRLNFTSLVAAQGSASGSGDAIVVGTGDRTVRLSRQALACMCSAYRINNGFKGAAVQPPNPPDPCE
jgi:hypothetical protein